jgi:hypothetical protein
MMRTIAVVMAALSLWPAWVAGQTAEFTVRAASATVHKSPSTGSPVIGTAPRGALLEVTREVGDWIKVNWPGSEEGAGYVHVSKGTLSPGLAPSAPAPTAATAESAPAVRTAAEVAPALAPPSAGTVYVPPPTHHVGFGGLVAGSTPAWGATTRVWSRNRIGLQVEVSRLSESNDAGAARLTAVQFSPSLVYSLTDVVTDYVWVRPYVGGGIRVSRAALSSALTDTGASLTDNSLAWRAHGGTELTFASVPRFAVSADAGYQKKTTPFPGYEIGGVGFTIAAHWYVR